MKDRKDYCKVSIVNEFPSLVTCTTGIVDRKYIHNIISYKMKNLIKTTIRQIKHTTNPVHHCMTSLSVHVY